MSIWNSIAAYGLGLLVVAVQAFFGWMEMFRPRSVFAMVLPVYLTTGDDAVWAETEKLACNMGLYNWFLALGLALGLALSLAGILGGTWATLFFLFCVAAAGAFALKTVSRHWTFGLQLGLGLAGFILFLGRL